LDNSTLTKQLTTEIETHIYPYYYNTAKTEISIRCPYCGDSLKSSKSAHLYIELRNEDMHRWYCQRCSEGGIVTPNFLKDIKIHNSDLTLNFFTQNSKIKYTKGKKKSMTMFAKKELTFPQLKSTDKVVKHLLYLNDRIGVPISEKEAREKYRVILSFKDFILHNDISTFTVDKKMLRLIDRHCIGFLSYDQSHIVFRSLDPKKTYFRYHIYNVFGNYNDTKRFYSINSDIDVLKLKLNVVIAEGTFDIIGVYEHFYKGTELDNHLFLSVNGKGYNLIFLHLARLGFLDMNIEIYSDKDVNLNFYKNMKKYSDILKNMKVKIYYNKIGKDYGVTREEIDLKYSII